MDLTLAVVAAAVGYLLGCISFARVVARLIAPNKDVTQTEMLIPGTDATFQMHSVSATAVSIHLGPRYGCLTSLLDMLKVALPTAIFRLAYPDQPYFLIVALAGLIGHCWPIFYGFKGGGGLSAIYGGMLIISPIGIVVTSMAGMALGLVLRSAPLLYLGGLWLIIPWLWLTTQDPGHVIYGIAINVLFMVAMIPEIKTTLATRKSGIKSDMATDMAMTPMGRMIMKMMSRIGWIKSRSQDVPGS
jgi:glycerol-3-phosphate acyltransferase PlsY